MEGIIKLVGMFGLPAFFGYLAYLFYDKNTIVSYILLIISIIAMFIVIGYELSFKKKRHDAPWLFENYKGE